MKRIVKAAMSVAALAILGAFMVPSANAAPKCSNATLKGSYSALITGTVAGLPLAELDLVKSPGNGTFSGTGTLVFNGSVSTVTISATYTVNPDCSGSATFSDGTTQNLNIMADGSEVNFIGTNDAAAVVTGIAKRLHPADGE